MNLPNELPGKSSNRICPMKSDSAMAKLNLLIIDDDEDQRFLTREVLEDKFGIGCVQEAGTGAAALVKELGSFDMILSDFNLPDCNGLELLNEIRSRCETPVILVTGENVAEFAAEAIRRGATDYVVKVPDYFQTIPLVVEKNMTVSKLIKQNEKLRADLERALADVRQTNQQLEGSLEKVEQMAATDALTGLYNRRHFGSVVEQLYSEARRYGHDLSCVMLDLDKYKQLNDTFGHQLGDQILTLVGRILKGSMRRADIAARYGGDEFVLLLPHADAAESQRLVQRIREEYRKCSAELIAREGGGKTHPTIDFLQGMSMSIGIGSISANNPSSAEDLVATADSALYASKQAGRDRVTIASGQRARLVAG
jgi:two-component system, cell cycle response regulator